VFIKRCVPSAERGRLSLIVRVSMNFMMRLQSMSLSLKLRAPGSLGNSSIDVDSTRAVELLDASVFSIDTRPSSIFSGSSELPW
jgi:hypothetical protein